MAALDQLTGLLQLLNGVKGQSSTTQTSGGSKTQQVQLSDEAVQQQIRNILSGSGGVRDIGNAARKSGLYNSTSEDLLLGNLYATAAAQSEIARAPVVTTSEPTTSTTTAPGVGLGATLGTIGGAALLSSILKSDTVSNAASSGVDSLLSAIGIGGKNGTKQNLDDVNGAVSFGAGPDTAIGLSGSIGESAPVGTGFSGDSFATQAGLGLPGVGDPTKVGASGNVSKGSDDFDLLGSVGSAISGFFSGGGLGGLVGAVTGGTGYSSGGSGGSSGGSIICTALMNKGLLDAELYAAGDAYIQKVSPITKVGYYVWARSIAAKIDQGHEGWTKVCLPLARGRTALLASPGKFMDHVKNPLGTLTRFIGEPVCHLIGLVVSGESLVKLYRENKGA